MNRGQQPEKTNKSIKCLLLLVCFSLMIGACTGNELQEEIPEPTEESAIVVTLPEDTIRITDFSIGITKINGTVDEDMLDWTNESMNEYSVMLVDAMPFLTVQADLSDLQVFEYIPISVDRAYEIDLPQNPPGIKDMQVMLLTVESQDCLIPGNQFYYCWDAELSSIAFEDSSQSKIIDGQVLVWAADDQQTFPNSIGADDKFFTDDDEQIALEPGYTIVDLSSTPFSFDHKGGTDIALYSNYDLASRDLSELSYTEAFDRIFNDMKSSYAFNGIEGKEPDWDAAYDLIYPQVQAAEESGDVNDWISALNAYTQQFSDSHVRMGGEVVDEWLVELYSHGLSFYFIPLSNGSIINTYGTIHNFEGTRFTTSFGGSTLLGINGVPIEDELNNIVPLFGSFSNPEMYYRAQVHDITHIYNDEKMEYQIFTQRWGNHDEKLKWAQRNPISVGEFYQTYYSPEKPVAAEIYSSEIGVITIHPDDFAVKDTYILFEKALKQFSAVGVDTIIINLRESNDNRFMNYAGFFTDNTTELGEMKWQQFGDSAGKSRLQSFVSHPQENQYDFERIAVLTGEFCNDACEADVYALSLLPQSTVYASTSTNGSLAIINSDPYTLPGDVIFEYSTGYFSDKNGELLIEGKGVQQDVLLEEELKTYLLDYDWQIPLIYNLLSFDEEMEIMPESYPQPLEITDEELNDIIDEIDRLDIEYLSLDIYPEILRNINYSYRVFVEDPEKLIVSEKWCTDEPLLYLYKGEHMKISFNVDGQDIDEKYYNTRILYHSGVKCWFRLAVLDNWLPGVHTVKINTKFNGIFFQDGGNSYQSGDYTEEYTVVVKESE